MYITVIYAPPGRHGELGRRIQQELCKDRANRAKRRLHAKMKQFTSKQAKEVKTKMSKDKGVKIQAKPKF